MQVVYNYNVVGSSLVTGQCIEGRVVYGGMLAGRHAGRQVGR